MQNLCDFEKNLLASLRESLGGRWPKFLGVAVSGGADSVSLLLALCAARDNQKEAANEKLMQVQNAAASERRRFPKIFCVTVDHSIRPESESSGDAEFVKALCQRLGVDCFVKKIERGLVKQIAVERKKGIEEAARFLRYKAFEEFSKECGASCICLAHNQNDALETILMRFLQGSGSWLGIAPERKASLEIEGPESLADGLLFLRPLLKTSRAQIESYLSQKGQDWRTDSSNGENNFLRNKIRNALVPFLDENFCGWKKALLSGAQKAAYDEEALELYLREKLEGYLGGASDEQKKQDGIKSGRGLFALFNSSKKDGGLEFSKELFLSLPVALRERLVYRAPDFFGAQSRIPFSFVKKISLWPEIDFKKSGAGGFEAVSKKEKVFVKKTQKVATESGFFDIIVERENEAFVERSIAPGDPQKLWF